MFITLEIDEQQKVLYKVILTANRKILKASISILAGTLEPFLKFHHHKT